MSRLMSIASLTLLTLTPAAALRAETSAPPALAGISVEEKPGAQLPLSAHFRSSTGQEISLGTVLGNGKPALLVLAYNRCTMLCSLVLRGVAELLRDLGGKPGDDFSVVTISIDPRETVHEAARLQAALLDSAGFPGQHERWPFLVGEQPEIDAVAAQLGFQYVWDERTEQYAHPAVVFAISRSGAVTEYFHGIRHDPAQVRAVLEGGTAAPRADLATAILSCFRFDTAQSRYGSSIAWLFKVGAASVAAALFFLVVWLLRHERTKHVREPS